MRNRFYYHQLSGIVLRITGRRLSIVPNELGTRISPQAIRTTTIRTTRTRLGVSGEGDFLSLIFLAFIWNSIF